MSKVSIELIHETAAEQLEPEAVSKLLHEIQRRAEIEAEAQKANREPVEKKQFVIVLSDPNGVMPETDLVGWVMQIPEDESPASTLDRIYRASYEYNISKKGRKYPVKSVGEACEAVGARFLKEQKIAVKTKVPVWVVVSDNRIPEGE